MDLRNWTGGIVNVLMTMYALVTLYPLLWLFMSAFKTNEQFFSRPFQFPTDWQWENFTRAWEVSDMGLAMFNSVIVTIVSLVLSLVIGALAAYVLSRFQFRFKLFFMGLFLLGMLIPIHSTLVPLFILMNKVHLLNTYWALILPYVAFELPIAIFITQAYMNTFPKDIEEAAAIDGTGYWGIFARIMLPLSLPALSTVAILAFLRFWNEFSFALVFISKPALKTLPLSLSMFATGYMTDYKLTMAALSLSVIPTIIVYLIFQKHIMQGMVAGAVKG
ncbi:carbohydrate ABC transporter permease [Paenibacillus alkaliterrae]|uniref:carbohydrate ABC transporter permease n=1 Tax=Paenibacillus alkaliterrae TaxID=320909 RepID=UPI001F2BD913|nr:carbohydrate ABC transporter permease [Paenibacillus alkaliterrae]MCF2938033.1 carbohydrate ABC transporter permease [Paenibacillus alkaliterrae]